MLGLRAARLYPAGWAQHTEPGNDPGAQLPSWVFFPN